MKFNKSLLAGTALVALAMGYGGRAQATTLCVGTFNFSGSIDSCTIAADGDYTITAVGAQGGTHSADSIPKVGGFGASVTGTFSFTGGDILQLLVGQTAGTTFFAGGGGGGSFVALGANTQPRHRWPSAAAAAAEFFI